jgi:DNA-binding response OmpR family regulator
MVLTIEDGSESGTVAPDWQALVPVAQWKPQMVLIDAGLPVTNGWQLARMIRSHFSKEETKLLILAARKTIAPAAHLRICDELLLKPVVMQKLCGQSRWSDIALRSAHWARRAGRARSTGQRRRVHSHDES